MLAFLLFPLVVPALQQDPAQVTTVEALAQRVEAAHRPKGDTKPITALTGNLELHVLDAEAEQRGQVDLAVRFMEWQQPNRKRTRPLIRYEVGHAGTVVVRGIDRDGPWLMHQGRPHALDSADFVRDLEECQRHTNLARQLLRFLSPGQVLRSLQQPTAVREEALQIGRTSPVPCQTVAGDLPAFPLLQRGGEDAPARLENHLPQRGTRTWTGTERRIALFDAAEPVGAGTKRRELRMLS